MAEDDLVYPGNKYGHGTWGLSGYSEWARRLQEIIASRPKHANFTNVPHVSAEFHKFKIKSCGSKRQFKTKDLAEFHAINGMHPYFCDFCLFWHVGHGAKNWEAIKQKIGVTAK